MSLSNIYDNYMSHVNYDQWVAKINVWAEQYSKHSPKRVFEIVVELVRLPNV